MPLKKLQINNFESEHFCFRCNQKTKIVKSSKFHRKFRKNIIIFKCIRCHSQKKMKELLLAQASDKRRKKFINSDPFYSSIQWRMVRAQILCSQKNCVKCGSISNLQVDHIKPRSIYPELALDIKNLQVLCEFCNMQKSNKIT